MFELMMWAVYGLFVGSIAKALIPGDEHMGFIKTIVLGVAGSYMGGAIMYLMGQYESVSAAGVAMGVVGSTICLILYNKLQTK